VIDLCNYCSLHGAEKDGYCSDCCRNSQQVVEGAIALLAALDAARLHSAEITSLRRALASFE
jgi:hypothetical protein